MSQDYERLSPERRQEVEREPAAAEKSIRRPQRERPRGRTEAGGNVMNHDSAFRERGMTEAASDVRARSTALNGGLDPVEMGRRSGQARRERKAARELGADFDKLTVSARAATALARTLTYEKALAVLAHLVTLAEGKRGASPGASVQATRELRDWLRVMAGISADDDTTPQLTFEEMTQEQRAAVRADIERELAQRGLERERDQQREGDDDA